MSADHDSDFKEMKRAVQRQVDMPIDLQKHRRQHALEQAGPGRSVLVVDDEVAMCEILSLYLGWKGLQVRTSQTAIEALDALNEAAFDLVLLDWDLAGVESLDLLNYFKGTWPQMAVILFTGKDTDETFLKRALDGRADAVLPKLGSLDSLWDEIRRQLTMPRTTATPSDFDLPASDIQNS